jgi:hypothetical protein
VAGTFGSVRAYQQVTGSFTGEVDPKDPKNTIIQDLSLAPLNANGKVEYTSDFVLYMPKDMSKANGVLRYDAPNRGNIVNLDPYFASRGYVFLTAAWQGDVPAATGKVTLTCRWPTRWQLDHGHLPRGLVSTAATTSSLALPGGAFNGAMLPYAPASLTTRSGATACRDGSMKATRAVSRRELKFATCSDRAVQAPRTAEHLPEPGGRPQAHHEVIIGRIRR